MAAAEKLTTQLMENRLLLFPTRDTDHEELSGRTVNSCAKASSCSGMTKGLLYSELEKAATALLGNDLVRVHAVPIAGMDAHTQRALLERTVKV